MEIALEIQLASFVTLPAAASTTSFVKTNFRAAARRHSLTGRWSVRGVLIGILPRVFFLEAKEQLGGGSIWLDLKAPYRHDHEPYTPRRFATVKTVASRIFRSTLILLSSAYAASRFHFSWLPSRFLPETCAGPVIPGRTLSLFN